MQEILRMLSEMAGDKHLILTGRGPSRNRAQKLRKQHGARAVEWRMNGYQGEDEAHAMWDIHLPQHHRERTAGLKCPVLIHPQTPPAQIGKGQLCLPFEPRNCGGTAAFMLGIAAHLRPLPAQVHLAGIDYVFEAAQDSAERTREIPSVEYWIGALREGLGVPVHIPAISRLCKATYR